MLSLKNEISALKDKLDEAGSKARLKIVSCNQDEILFTFLDQSNTNHPISCTTAKGYPEQPPTWSTSSELSSVTDLVEKLNYQGRTITAACQTVVDELCSAFRLDLCSGAEMSTSASHLPAPSTSTSHLPVPSTSTSHLPVPSTSTSHLPAPSTSTSHLPVPSTSSSANFVELPQIDSEHYEVGSKHSLGPTIAEIAAAGLDVLKILNPAIQRSTKPVMLPPMPDQKLIDVFAKDDTSKAKKLEEQQRTYEAECSVYRALERLNVGSDTVIVLHNLKYTKEQCALFVADPKQGEHDFLVIIKDKAVVAIEVKAPLFDGTNSSKTFERNLKSLPSSSTNQLKKIDALVKGVIEKSGGLTPSKIFKYSIFTSVDKQTACQFEWYMKLLQQNDKLVDHILFKDDLEMFDVWWDKNIFNKLDNTSNNNYLKVESILLGLWCVNNVDHFDTKQCILSHWITETDKKLKYSLITSSRDGKPYTKNVVKTSPRNKLNVFRKYLDIEFLTKAQEEIFQDSRVFISGPAGTGKTILIQGKIIQLVKEGGTTEKIFIFLQGKNNTDEYANIFHNAGISALVLEADAKLSITSQIDNSSYKVIIVYFPSFISRDSIDWFMKVLPELKHKNCHLFLDDMQCFLWRVVRFDPKTDTCYSSNPINSSNVVDVLSEVLSSNIDPSPRQIVWFACDVVQYHYFNYSSDLYRKLCKLTELLSQLPAGCVKTLASNLRNTADLSNLLSAIRSRISSSTGTLFVNFIPDQQLGHYIHGTLPRLYVIHEWEKSLLKDTVSNTVDELFSMDPKLQYSDLAVIRAGYGSNRFQPLLKLFKKQGIPFTAVNSASNGADEETGVENGVWIGDIVDTPSLEWSAVIVMFDVRYDTKTKDRNTLLPWLYSVLSRARVHCTIILRYTQKTLEGAEYLVDLLEKYVLIKKLNSVDFKIRCR